MATTKQPKQNVRVAIRLRPMSEQETREKARSVVSVQTEQRAITVRDRNNMLKTFPSFDRVYGKDSSQADIYNDLVEQQVQEVLQGYNCTIFAYGQTASGKTYTMEGHEAEAPSKGQSWRIDEKCGIIPRALDQVFSELEKQELEEFSVRVSFVELYNEELFDLLAANYEESNVNKLRLYEDPLHKGSVVIYGMEEAVVRNRQEVHQLLRKGAERRTTAATLMNQASSRSHSVFTINVMTRENSLGSEELLKQGKLHLVDLAGSENIGRSGAIDRRAREAGSINQSLLTLGRVINALTTNAGHVPYRESKLTRLLQDSLGGRTITTIIATISPASINVEETLSTLEYAQRAKNIKNHPEINQKLSKKALLKGYNDEIERLRRDLMATREKNGVFMAQANYDEMFAERSALNEKLTEYQEELECLVAQMQKTLADLTEMDFQYRRVYERNSAMANKLELRRAELEQLMKELADAKRLLEAKNFCLEIIDRDGDLLYKQAAELHSSHGIVHHELELLHDRMSASRTVLTKNDAAYVQFSTARKADIVVTKAVVSDWHGCLAEKRGAAASSSEWEKVFVTINERLVQLDDGLKKFVEEETIGSERRCVDKCIRLQDDRQRMKAGLEDLKKMHTEIVNLTVNDLKCIENEVKEIVGQCDMYRLLYEQKSSEFTSCLRQVESEFNSKLEQLKASVTKTGKEIEDFSRQTIAELGNLQTDNSAKLRDLDQLFSAVDNRDHVTTIHNAARIVHETSNQRNMELSQSASAIEEKASLLAKWNDENSVAEQSKLIAEKEKLQLAITQINVNANSMTSQCRRRWNDFDSQLKNYSQNEEQNRKAEEKLSTEHSQDLSDKLDAFEQAVDQFFKDGIDRLPVTGTTPKKVNRPLPNAPRPLPKSVETMEIWEAIGEPRRSSASFRVRDSILDVPVNVLSPNTLKAQLHVNKLENVNEEKENDAVSEAETTSSTRSARRRV